MRLVALGQSLWLDEAIGALAVRDFSYSGIINEFLKFDNHPPLYYLDLKFWASFFGYSDISLRLPSVIYGVLTVYTTFLIAKKLSSKKNIGLATFSALLLAASPFHIYYSQEARMYSLAAFLASLAIYSYLFLIDEAKQRNYFGLFSFSITALLFTDYVPVFLLPVFWIYAFLKKKHRLWWGKYLLAHVPLVIFGALWSKMFLIQAEKGRWLMTTLPAWKQIGGGATFKQAALVWMKFILGRISFQDKIFYYSLVAIASVPFLFVLLKSLRSLKNIKIVWLWLVLPLLLGFISSFWAPFFIYFRFLYVVPAFYLLVAYGVLKTKSFKLKVLLAVCLLIVNVVGWIICVGQPHQQREQWRQATEFVESRIADDEVVVFGYPEPFAPYRWYTKGNVQAVGVTDSISPDLIKTRKLTNEAISDKSGVYYFEYLKGLSDSQNIVQQIIGESGFSRKEAFNFHGVGLVEYFVR
jgi:uncharacterized membrane protein